MLGVFSSWKGHRILRLRGTGSSIRSARSICISSAVGGSGGGARRRRTVRPRSAACARNGDRGLQGDGDRGLSPRRRRGRRLGRWWPWAPASSARCRRCTFVPTVRGVAPGPAEFQVDPDRHRELHGLAAEPRHQFALLARASPSIQAVVHLQQRHDALAPAGAHPQLGVPRGRALDQRIERGVGAGATQLLAVPRMLGVRHAAPRLFDAHGPAPLA